MLNTTVPVGVPHVGCVMDKTVGVVGDAGIALIVTVEAALVVQSVVVFRTVSV